MISIKQIYYALTLAKTCHFKQAADLCHVSQSTLSSAIHEFEKQLGLTVFERDNKKVLITTAGQQILPRLRQIKLEIDDLQQFSMATQPPLSQPLAIGVIPTIGPFLLPIVLPTVRQAYPQIQLSLREAQTRDLLRMVKNGELDTAIIALPFGTEGLHCFSFWKEDFYVIAHKSNLCVRASQTQAKDIPKEKLLLLEEGHCLKDHTLEVCKFRQTDVGNTFSGTSLYTLIQMVCSNMGVTIIPQMAINSLLQDNTEVGISHLQEPGPHREIAFVCRLNYPRVTDIQTLLQLFQHCLQNKTVHP